MTSDHHGCVVCPCCRSSDCVERGVVRGLYGRIGEFRGRLWECIRCRLWFRTVGGSLADGEIPYAGVGENEQTGWRDLAGRPDVPLACEWIAADCADGARVLDVGCFCGDLLSRLSSRYVRMGIEPSDYAASQARGAGISVAGPTIEKTELAEDSVDHIVMLNVFEHLSDPLGAMERLVGWLRSGGCLTIGTGTTDSLPWRLLGPEHWYCRIEGHCVFLNRFCVEWAAAALGMDVERWQVLPHRTAPWQRRLREWTHLFLYSIPRQSGMLGEASRHVFPFSRSAGWQHAPVTTHLPDHVVFTLRKRR